MNMIICRCGVKFRKKEIPKYKLCDHCYEIERLDQIEKRRKQQLSNKKSELRKWYKWVCKNELYHKSIKIIGVFNSQSINYIGATRVLDVEDPIDCKWNEINNGPLSGMRIPTHYKINGYYRVYELRTGCDGEKIYNTEWRAGITNENLGNAVNQFQQWLRECAHKNRSKRHEIEMIRDREKKIAQFTAFTKPRDIIRKSFIAVKNNKSKLIQKEKIRKQRLKAAYKYSGSFFQMQAASISISEYATTINQ